jgi:two-component system response regulator
MQNRSERNGRPITILMADDDEDDRDLTRDALEDADYVDQMDFVADGQDLIDYLRQSGPYGSPENAERPRPSIILLDLNMPRMDGREALAALKSDEALRRIPVVVLTTSHDDQDVRHAYDLGANSYITKPVTGSKLESVLGRLTEYWSQIVTLPDPSYG